MVPVEQFKGSPTSRIAVAEYPTANGPADYTLIDGDRILGVAEAKKLTIGPDGVLPQAERYSKGVEQTPRYQGEFGVPFLYSKKRRAGHVPRRPLAFESVPRGQWVSHR